MYGIERLNNHAPERIRALFLSDFHFGYKGIDTLALLDCLKHYHPEKIYLVGDIIDGWKLKKRWFWKADYTRIIDALVAHKKRGAKILYLPGNHDERVKKLNPFRRARFSFRAGLRICNSCIHKTKDGKRIIVLHGDQFDNALISGPVSKAGDWFYEFLSDFFGLSQRTPKIVIDGKLRPFSLAKLLMKKSGQAALRLMNRLEGDIHRLVRRKMADGLICGHTHVPALKEIKDQYIYGNCGMWMGHTNTALIETMDGLLELKHWADMRSTLRHENISASQAVGMAEHRETAFIIRKVRQLWPDPVYKAQTKEKCGQNGIFVAQTRASSVQ